MFSLNSQNLKEQKLTKVATPNKKTVKEVADFFKTSEYKVVKSILYLADQELVLVLVPGDHEISEAKLSHGLK